MSTLIDSAAAHVGESNIYLDSPVRGLQELPNNRVRIKSTGPTEDFDKVILAIPPSAANNIRERPRWTFMKEASLRSLHYEPLYKIGIRFRTRFWEHTSAPCFGGQSTTDLRFRWIVYPSDNIGAPGSGVLMLYSWMTDAAHMASNSPGDRIRLALYDLNKFFEDEGIDVFEQYVEHFDVAWAVTYAQGDAQFLPGQFT
ncbi:hypothetical protein LTS18_001355, partial [Coniosporium uncinatum]